MKWLMHRWHRGFLLGWFLAATLPDDYPARLYVLIPLSVVIGCLLAAAKKREDRARATLAPADRTDSD